MYIYSLHLYTMITSNHDSGTCLSIAYTFIQWLLPIMIQVYVYIAYTFIPWLLPIMIQVYVYIAFTFIPWLLVIMIQVHVYILFARLYHDYFQSWFRYMYIYSLHVYTMITSNHDSGTCISIACKFIPWLLLIKIQVHVHL
jgi:hypothetical protein